MPYTIVPLFRLFKPHIGHHFTTSDAERSLMIGDGWHYEGIACYVFARCSVAGCQVIADDSGSCDNHVARLGSMRGIVP